MIKVFDTKLISPEMFWEVVYLPYKFTRTDDINPEGNPSDAQATMYWTHQLYNFCPVEDPDYHMNAGLEASNNKIYLDVLNYLEAILSILIFLFLLDQFFILNLSFMMALQHSFT